MASHPETITFLGASTGVGLSALKHTLATGRRCIALCRNPAKLTDILPAESHPNLEIVQGNARDVADVSRCLLAKPGILVDSVVSTVGSAFIASKMTLEDPTVCRVAMASLLEAIAQHRQDGAVGRPYIIACSTTGMSRFGRDVPIIMIPFYHVMLKAPHEDKRIMEDRLVGSGEDFTIVRASLLTNGESTREVRVGVEDPKAGRESNAIGYTISREDAGRWFAENLVPDRVTKYVNKIVMITY